MKEHDMENQMGILSDTGLDALMQELELMGILSDTELDALMQELELNPYPMLPVHQQTLTERAVGWMLSKIFFNSESFGEDRLRSMASKGHKFFTRQHRRADIIQELSLDIDAKARRIRKVLGRVSPLAFLTALDNLFTFCTVHSQYAEVHSMELGLPTDTAYDLAAYIYRPLFYWELFKALFAR